MFEVIWKYGMTQGLACNRIDIGRTRLSRERSGDWWPIRLVDY